MKRNFNLMKKTYESYYSNSYSFRDNWFGEINSQYIIPKYFSLIANYIGLSRKKISLLELGAGNGEVTDYLRANCPQWKITPTEFTKNGVEGLRQKGYGNARVVDALNIPFKNKSFDYVVCFDVMHHVPGPAKMAYEMSRVAKKGVFLIEANRQSIIRRLLERTAIYKRAGEFSYYPLEYRAFFNLPDTHSIQIKPFQFIPPKIFNFSLPLTIAISETIANIPVLKWQCSGLAITVTNKKL